jgi:uncharacterized protein (DUF2147 family)
MSLGKRRLLSIGLAVVASVLVTSPKPASADEKTVFGYWKHLDDDSGQTQSIFKLFENKGKLMGRIEKTFDTPKKKAQKICSECTGSQKDKPIVGLIFFWDFTRDKDDANKWVDGKILNPEDGKVYNAEAELAPDGKTLKVFGYIRVVIKIGGSSVWKRPTPAEIEGL